MHSASCNFFLVDTVGELSRTGIPIAKEKELERWSPFTLFLIFLCVSPYLGLQWSKKNPKQKSILGGGEGRGGECVWGRHDPKQQGAFSKTKNKRKLEKNPTLCLKANRSENPREEFCYISLWSKLWRNLSFHGKKNPNIHW